MLSARALGTRPMLQIATPARFASQPLLLRARGGSRTLTRVAETVTVSTNSSPPPEAKTFELLVGPNPLPRVERTPSPRTSSVPPPEPTPEAAPSSPEPTPVTPAAATSASAPSPAPAKDDVSGPMLEPSVVNTGGVRTVAMFGAILAAAGSTALLPSRAVGFLTIASYGLWLGTIIWNTFFVGLTMFKHMPRQTFGRVQAQLFPKYFWLTAIANTLLVAASVVSASLPHAATVTLGTALAATLGNALYLEPRATKLMFARYELENKANKTAEDKSEIAKLYKAFGKFHGMSSLLNLVVTCAALAFGWQLSGVLAL